MGFWMRLVDEKSREPLKIPFSLEEGGTYPVGGTDECLLKVTGNYSQVFDFDQLEGKTASETLHLLAEQVAELGTERDDDYWKPTNGNVGYACSILGVFALYNPRGIWEVD